MAYRVKQFRYYDDASSKSDRNQPTKMPNDAPVKFTDYTSGEIFDSCYPILQLGIQALPGTEFLLNESLEPVLIGQTGIYELNLSNGIQITKLTFSPASMVKINNNKNAFLIVDVMYDDGEE